MHTGRNYVFTWESRAMSARSRLSKVLGVVTATLVLSVGGPSQAAEIGTVLNATSDGSGNLIDITYGVQGNPETLLAEDLIGSTLVLSTLQGRVGAPSTGDANRFWTLDGAPEPTEAEALRSLGDKYMGTALQDCSSTSAHDTLFDQPIIPGPGPEIFIYHGGHNDPFVVLDENGSPALTIPNAPGNPISVALSSQFKAWYLQDNVNYAVVGTFPHVDTQSHIVALDLSEFDIDAIGGLRFAGGPCDYVYEILGRQPDISPSAVFGNPEPTTDSSGFPRAIWLDVDGDGDLDIVSAGGGAPSDKELVWQENDGFDPQGWQARVIDTAGQYGSLDHGDVDGDGDTDLIVTDAAGFGSLVWYENDGASPPSFTERTIPNITATREVVVDDLDGDGDTDFALTGNGGTGLAWVENSGEAIPTWTVQVLSTGIVSYPSLTTADFDGDGDVDILVSDQGACPTAVELYENDGGSPPVFTPRVVGSLDDTGYFTAAGDLDGDGDIDFVVTGTDCDALGQDLVWFENDGGAMSTFTRHQIAAGNYFRLRLQDVNLDGDLDIVAAGGPGGVPAQYFENDGAASPGWTARNLPAPAGGQFFWADTGDFDRDGDFDLLTTVPLDGIVYVIENRTIHRNAVFPVPSVITTTGGGTANSVFAADVDGDGDPDSLTAGADTFAWHENDGASPPSWTQRAISTTGGGTANSVFAADVDGDGDVDAFTAGADTFAWHENNALDVVNPDFELLYKAGSTTVTSPVFPDLGYAFGSSPLGMSGPTVVTFSDGSTGNSFDMPGWQWDTVVGVTNVNNRVTGTRDMVLFMNGAGFGGGTDAHPVTQVLTASLEQDVRYTLTADFGWRTDNAVPSNPAILELYAGATLLTPTAVSSPALIKGEWVTHSRTYLVSNPAISGPLKIEIGLGANTTGQQLNIDRITLRKHGGATLPSWTQRTIATTGVGNANSVFGADVDGDGDLDALTAGGDTFAWHENDGATPPSWTQRTIATTGGGDANSVLAADVDGDGDLDALTAGAGTIAWHENDGATPPSWTPRTIATTGGGDANSVFAADFDHDGDLDALTAGAGTIAWYENDGATPPTWTQSVITTTGGDANSVFAADVDRDGDVDAVSAWADTIAWHENRGGQFNNTAVECGTGNLPEGEESFLASTTVRLNARPGDSPGRVSGVSFDLGLAPSDLKNVIETLRLYRDDGSGAFEPGEDVLLDTVDVATFLRGGGGDYWISFPGDDPNGIVAAPATFFLTGQVSSNASAVAGPLLVSNGPGNTDMSDANAGVNLTEGDDGLVSSCLEARPILRTLVVDDFSDGVDANPTDGVCATAGASCTLRAAITEANATPGPDRIALPAGTYQLALIANDNTNDGGDLDINDDLTLVGAGADVTTIDGALINRVLNTNGAITVSISDLTVTGGQTAGPGGGLFVDGGGTVELNRCVIEGNSAGSTGGGIAAGPGSFLQLVDSRVVGNDTPGAGGGIHSTATVNVVWSEFSGNSADGGGGVYTNSVLQVLGSTISGNDASGSSGGGVLAEGTAFVAFSDSTIAQNSAAIGGGVSICPACTANSYSTILADNNGGASDCVGTLLSGGYTLVKNTSGCTVSAAGTDQLNVDPLLAPLGNYGGSTLTHRLQLGSPAIDAGSCVGPSADRDQTGQPRPVDDLDTANADDSCDIGAYEARLGQTQPPIEIPIRWCAVRGAPSVQNPSLVGQNTVNDVLRSRHESASDEIYRPQTGIVLRSGGNFIIEDYPILDAPACVETSPDVFTCDDAREAGDVVLNLETGDFSEFHDLVAACRVAWEALDPNIHGITAVHINAFIDPAGGLLDIIGVGGRAPFGDAVEQSVAGRVMVVDNFYRLGANPADTNDRLFGHEIGHALSLLHGNGLDDNLDQLLDNNDEIGTPRFDGPNLLQYRDGDTLTPLQALQMRIHALVAIPGAGLAQFSDSVAAGTPIDEETDEILQWGFRELLELEQDEILQFEEDEILQFEEDEILQWEEDEILQWEEDEILQWEEDEILQWEQDEILQFGATFDGSASTDTTTFHISLAELPWPASVRPDTRFYFYLDLDTSDSTGAYPAFFPIPGDSPNNFPGLNNLEGEPPIGDELGVDVILEVKLTSDCPGGVCSSFADLRAFDFNAALQAYESFLATTLQLDLTAYGVGLYRDNGGVEPDVDDVPVGITIRVAVPNSILFAAGWGFQTGPNGPVPNSIGMEAASTVECSGQVLNTDPSSASADCSCATCGDCGPGYPGCGPADPEPKQPRVLSGSRIVIDHDSAALTFEPPILPRAIVAPVLAEEGQIVTVYVLDLPTDVTGQVEVSLGGVVLATVPTSAIDAGGEVSLSVPLPLGVVGEQTLSSGISGFAPRATTRVTITPSLAFPDNDGDGIDDATDPDDDNDGVDDVGDSDPLNPFVCADSDFDTCDDCNSGSLAPLDDGPDFDLDGQCNAGDPDDDNDGVDDVIDGEPFNPNACGDIDNDLCDDCAVVSNAPSPNNDGADLDGDGLCDRGDPNQTTPVVGEIIGPPVDPVPVGTTITASASFTDGDFLDTHTADWDWGDGTITSGTVTETGGAGDVEGAHTYTVPGVYRIQLTVSDDLDFGTSAYQFVVVFDPTGGFVTGGGWIDSPAGAYTPNPVLIGKAHFGFVSKYKKGANVPTGNTEFEFAVADLLFKSTDYDWLVIAGHTAKFKGSGTINGLGNYGFLLSAIDEKLTPSTDVDLFRIKIWDKDAADMVVYDNLMGGADDDDPATPLGGGSIVIHKSK